MESEQNDPRCAECGTTLAQGQDHEVTDDGTFCRPCFDNLTAQLRQALAAQGQEINYPMALVGGSAVAPSGRWSGGDSRW